MEPEKKQKKEKKEKPIVPLTEEELAIPMKDILASSKIIGATVTGYDESFIYIIKTSGQRAALSRSTAIKNLKKKRYLNGRYGKNIYDEQNPKPERMEIVYTESQKAAHKQATLIRKQAQLEARQYATLMEKQCNHVLEDMFGVKFVKIRPAWLKNLHTEKPLEFDHYNEEFNVAFEYQDLHHYQKVDYGINHEIVKINDKNKRRACIEYGVRLFCIPACDDPDILAQMIITIVGNSLPDLIIRPKYKR